jgi:hypothetical protein
MGEASNKAKHVVLTEEMRAGMLGDNPFIPAYDFLFAMLEPIYTASGCIDHQLIGIAFQDGMPTGINVVNIRRIEDVPRLREQMLQRWPLVAHVFEAWVAPDTSAPPSKHPERVDVVSIMLNTSDILASAPCRVDPVRRTIERAELTFPDRVDGRLGRELPTRH